MPLSGLERWTDGFPNISGWILCGVKILGDDKVASNYVPSTICFRQNYGVSEQIDLSNGLERWIEWLIKSKKT